MTHGLRVACPCYQRPFTITMTTDPSCVSPLSVQEESAALLSKLEAAKKEMAAGKRWTTLHCARLSLRWLNVAGLVTCLSSAVKRVNGSTNPRVR